MPGKKEFSKGFPPQLQNTARCIYKNRLGKRGELIARQYLINLGLTFRKANYRYSRSEIDLIFIDEPNTIVIFVEVKIRTSKKFGEPEESITYTKQQNIKKAAIGFISEHPEYDKYDLRLDVLTIMKQGTATTINHIENAF